MKLSNTLSLSFLLLTAPCVFAQSLPDEINYPHYEKIKNEDTRIRDIDSQVYDATVKARISTEQSISSDQAQIQQQQTSLSQAKSELSQRNQDQNVLDQNINRADNQLRKETADYNRELSLWQSYDRDYQQVLRVYQPINTRYENQRARLAQEEQQRRHLEVEVSQNAAELDRLEKKLGSIPSEIARGKQEVAKLKARITKLSQESTTLTAKVADLKQKINTDDARLTTLKQDLTEINKEISLLKRQIENARSTGADPAEIKKLEDAEAAKTKEREAINIEKRTLETKLAPLKADLLSAEAELNITQKNLSEAEKSLVSEEKTLDRLIAEESQLSNQIAKAKQDLSRSTAALRVTDQNLAIIRRDFSIAEREWRDTVQLVETRKRELELQIQRVSVIQQRKEALERELAQLTQNSNQNISAMNSLAKEIQTTEQSLSRLTTELNTLLSNLSILQRDEIAHLEKLNQSQSRLNVSSAAFEKRLALFEKHEDAAIALGQSEASNTGSTLGDKDGLKIGAQTASQVGQELGVDLGSVQGKLWANIRAEGQGYSIGYANGRKAPVDMERAKLEGGKKGEEAANLHLEQVLRPKYFVQFLDELVEKAEVLSSQESKVAGLATPVRSSIPASTVEKNLKAQANQDPQALTAEEIALSQKIKTNLDTLIAQGSTEARTLEAKAIQLENPSHVYQAPSSIPYGKSNCLAVYKDLAIFKTACSNAYKSVFSQDYTSAHKASFSEIYIVDYKKHLSQKQILNRSQVYAATFPVSYKIAEGEGFKIGADETFQETVKEQYDLAYAETLKSGDIVLRAKISSEVQEHVKNNATLGLVSANLDQTVLVPGSMGKIEVMLKNISPKAFSGAVSMKITKVENVLVAANSSVLQSLEGSSKGIIPAIDYKISPDAKAGSNLIIEGVVDLPGDKYRSVKSVKFQIKKVLGKNLVPELSFKFDETPAVKSLFGVNKHTIKLSLSPKYDAAANGYKVVLSPSTDSAAMIELKDKEATTSALSMGQKAEVKLTYKLTRAAKGKVLTMTCDIYSEGILIEQKLIRLNVKK